MTKRRNRRRRIRRKRRKRLALWILFGGVAIIMGAFLYQGWNLKRPFKESFKERAERVDSLIRGSLFSLGLKERDGVDSSIPYQRTFILPSGTSSERVRVELTHLLRGSGYRVRIEKEGKMDHTILKVRIDGRLSHILSLYPSRTYRAKVAIVIDDIGHNLNLARKLMELPVTFSILPYRPYSVRIAEEARAKGREVLLHLPMEAKDPGKDPGKGSLLVSMSSDEIRRIVDKDLRAVPYIKGVNNHMGSLFTEDGRLMEIVLEEVKERGLFFLDSKTTSSSTGYTLAKMMGLKAMERDVFIDNERDVDYIKKQLKRLMEIAKRRGYGIAIGHPHPSTIAAIREMLPSFEKEGIEVVPVSSLP